MSSRHAFHPLQKRILKKLGYNEEKSFSNIKGDAESNKLSFHLNKLQEEGLVGKTESGYRLTANGRELLPYFDLEEEYHPVVVADLLVFSGDKVYLKPKEKDPLDPFEGNYRAPSSRIGKNERLEETAQQIFRDEFNCEPEYIQKNGVFDSQVKFSDGSRQQYLVFYFSTEKEEASEENWYDLSKLGNLSLLPGLEKTTRKIRWSDSVIIGTWDIKETSKGFNVEKLEF